ncbi:MAG: cache domain-containing protein [Sterolibacterium sp.]
MTLFEAEKKATLAAHSFAIVSNLADDLDAKLRTAHSVVIAVAATVPQRAMEDYETSEAFLDRQVALHALFDNGLFLVAPDGRLIGESPPRPYRRGSDVSAREYFHKTLDTRKPYVSKPYRSTHKPGEPALIMTAPVFDKAGNLIGLLYGSMDLLGSNILADISKRRIGRTGYIYIADGRDTMIAHPDKSRIMRTAATPGENRVFDRAIDGWEGTDESVNSKGVKALLSVKRLKTTGWIVGANLPLEEFYEPIREAQRYFLWSTAIGTIVILCLVWLLIHRLIQPLSNVTRQVHSMVEVPGVDSRLTITSVDEIGVLAHAFNSMLDRLLKLNGELEDRVSRRTAELQAANKELESFAYSVSHDLRAPLRHIDGYVDLLVSRCRNGLTDKGLHYVDTIAASARQMGILIDDLLQFSRTGRVDLHRESLDMNQVLKEVLAPLEKSNAGRTIEWVVGDLPSVPGDSALLRQALTNLLGNAVKYTRQRETARIEVSARVGNGEIIFVVADNGVGFDMQYAGKLFGVFQRLHSQDEFEGTGIGLATVKRIVERHGGRVWAEGDLNQGARFYFTLPTIEVKNDA